MEGILVKILAVIEITLICFTIYCLTKVTGTADTNNGLTKTLVPVVATLVAIILVHTILWLTYFTQNPLAMNYYFIVSGAITMLFSLTALSVSLINV